MPNQQLANVADSPTSAWPLLAPKGPAEAWLPPSAEHRWLLRNLTWLVAPADGKGNWLSRTLRCSMVAPMTQLTLFSFDLQCFLYQVFHTSWTARLGHLFGMTSQILFLFAALSPLSVPGIPLGAADVALVVLAVWHVSGALQARLKLWSVIALALLVGLRLAGGELAVVMEPSAPLVGSLPNAWLGVLVSAWVVASSHGGEPNIPPRASSSTFWRPPLAYLLGRGESGLTLLDHMGRLFRLAAFFPLGVLNELWAGFRLMPYGWLYVMFRLGYAPDLWRTLCEREKRALANGNPAIDYVGVGGETMLVPET